MACGLGAWRSCSREDLLEMSLESGAAAPRRAYSAYRSAGGSADRARDLAWWFSGSVHSAGDNRAGMSRTCNRISAIRNRLGEVVGLPAGGPGRVRHRWRWSVTCSILGQSLAVAGPPLALAKPRAARDRPGVGGDLERSGRW